jgi:hypothetical protein
VVPLEPRERNKRRTQRHQEKIERRRVLAYSQKCEGRIYGIRLRGPRLRISVAIRGAEHEECGNAEDTEYHEGAASTLGRLWT